MTRIGFAYNQKPSLPSAESPDALRADEEPPNLRHSAHRTTASPNAAVTAVAAPAAGDDEFAEWDSPETLAAVERALSTLGDVVRLEATADFPEQLRAARPDIVFNIAEGLSGPNREAHVPAICEFFGIPYSGSDPFTLSLCLDKARTKEVLAFHGVPTAHFALVRDAGEIDALCARVARAAEHSLRLPLFVKPVHEGSSKGITERNYCETVFALRQQLAVLIERYDQPVLVEEYLPGREFTCGVLGNGSEATVLPIVGMNFAALPSGALPIYGFEAKWEWDRPESPLDIFECPARIDTSLRHAIERVTLSAYRVLGCRDWSRVDVRLAADGTPNIVEVNPLPGILPDPADNSCLPKAARAAGLGYDDLIRSCLLAAARRVGVPLADRANAAWRETAAHSR